ncbi:hypothetical protein OGAPHI_006285 [Ogataea philodendri]|uniref:Uncharacterized protein n=1 Tax=Ogataea philodendri TaxID=1378263 RepID=A0A9P8T1F7_9ASCO|nr:uncharacterized protein OGAPHI_006285 [Ogataea philodendri]KAH3662104.1 hypothetical protein OGAPHI_006285 [Ogataea philodendri]
MYIPSVSPWLVVRGENSQVTPSHKLVIVQRQHRVTRVEKLWVENDLHLVLAGVEQLARTDLVQDRIVGIIHHVVGHNWRQRVSLQRKHPSFQVDSIGRTKKVIQRWQLDLSRVLGIIWLLTELKQPFAHETLHVLDGAFELLDDCLTTQSIDSVRLGGSWHNDESNHIHVRVDGLEFVVQPGKGFDEKVNTFVSVLISSRNEKIKGVFQLEIELSVEMATNKLVDFLLLLGMQVLELVNSLELDHVQSVRKNSIWLPFQQVLTFVCGNVGNSGEDVCRVRSRPFNAVPMIDASFSSLVVDVELIQVVVKVHTSRTEVSSQQSCMGREDGCAIDFPLSTERNGHASKPLMGMQDDCLLCLMATKFSKEPGSEIPQHDCIVGFDISFRRRDSGKPPQVGFPFVQIRNSRANIKQNNSGCPLN